MPFGNKATGAVAVYVYGAPKGVAEGNDLVETQMRLAHRYKNQLAEIERLRRKRRQEAFRTHGTLDVDAPQAQVDAVKAELAGLREAIAGHRKESRRRHIPDEWKQRRTDVQKHLKTLYGAWREAKLAALKHEPLQAELARINDQSRAEIKRARSHSGLYWGTYLHVERGAEAYRRSSAEPRFQRFDGSGTVAVQIQNGLSVEEVFSGTDRRLRVDPLPYASPSTGRRPRVRTQVRMRIGSTEKGEPVWAAIPIVMHRPLPEGGQIKWALLVRRRTGRRMRYSVQFVVEHLIEEKEKIGPQSGAVAIDINWRLIPEGLRAAYWVGDDGQSGTIVLPQEWLKEMGRVDDLNSKRDLLFNRERAALLEWMDGAESIPDWLQEHTKTIRQWKSIGRLAGVVKRWREEERFAGNQEIYDRLEAWRAQDAHLLEWASNLRDQLLLRRREVYRVAAARLSERYRTCVVEEMNLAAFARRDGPAEDAPDKVRLMRHRAALSTLRQALGRRMRTVIIPSAYTTQECHACGYVQKLFDAAKQLRYRCEACGSEWDQDENAARNLLRRYLDQRDDRETTGGARAI